MYRCTVAEICFLEPWKFLKLFFFSKSAHVWWWNYTNVLCSVQNVCLPTTSNQHPLPSSAAVRCVTRDLPDTWNTPSSVWVSPYITQSLHANLTTHPLQCSDNMQLNFTSNMQFFHLRTWRIYAVWSVIYWAPLKSSRYPLGIYIWSPGFEG